jgi:hypothetical protein
MTDYLTVSDTTFGVEHVRVDIFEVPTKRLAFEILSKHNSICDIPIV